MLINDLMLTLTLKPDPNLHTKLTGNRNPIYSNHTVTVSWYSTY